MSNVNTELLDASVRHQIYLERYGTTIAREMLRILISSEKQAREIFDARISRILELGYDQGPRTSKRTDDLIKELAKEIEAARVEQSLDPLAIAMIDEWAEEFAEYENGFQLASLNKATSAALDATPFAISFEGVALSQVLGAALAKPFSVRAGGDAQTLGSWLDGIPDSERRRIEDAIRGGVVNGETTRDIVRRVFGTIQEQKTNKGNAAVIKTRRGVESLVRTAITHISTVTRDEIYKENNDLVKGVEWISTLDSRTTPVCIKRDGTIYPVDSGPRPPAHIGCRSSTAPKLKSYAELGLNVTEPEKSTRAYLAIPEKMNVTQYRRELAKQGLTKAQQTQIISNLSGQTDAKDWESFLSRQTKDFQETVLGVERTRLYREGGLTLKQLIAPNDQFYTIDDLRRLHPDQF